MAIHGPGLEIVELEHLTVWLLGYDERSNVPVRNFAAPLPHGRIGVFQLTL